MKVKEWNKKELQNLKEINTRATRLTKINLDKVKELIENNMNHLSDEEFEIVKQLIGIDCLKVLESGNHQFFRTVHPLEVCNEYFVFVDDQDTYFVSHISNLKYDKEIGMTHINILLE